MKRLALILAFASACSPAYSVGARVTHAKRTCAPVMLEELDFAGVLALLAVGAVSFKADHQVRSGFEFAGAVGIAVGSTVAGATCAK